MNLCFLVQKLLMTDVQFNETIVWLLRFGGS